MPLRVNHLVGFGARQASGGGGGGLILDGKSPTGAFSLSRDLLTAFVGGARYNDTAGAITDIQDQSGNNRDLTDGATSTRRPTLATAGPNSLACADFDGSSDFLTGNALTDYISASDGFMVATVIIDAVTGANHDIVSDTNRRATLFASNTAGLTFNALHYDNTNDTVAWGSASSTGTAYVLSWRHEGGTLYLSVNGATEVSVASGNLVLGGNLTVGARTTSVNYANMKLFELATFSAVPASGDRSAIIADFMTHVGI